MTTQKQKTMPLGELADCRVIETGIGDFAECAQWGPVDCSHAMPLGCSVLCMHPRVNEIIENTKKSQPFVQTRA